MNKAIFIAVAMLALSGCASVPRNTGTSYACSGGTKLKVDYAGNGAIVRINGNRTLVLKQTPSVSGPIYENKTGARLQRNGNEVVWNTAARTAPETCQVTYTPL